MDAQQRRYLAGRYRARDWHGRGGRARPVIKDFNIDGSEIRRWSLQRVQREERAKPPVIRSIWRHGETMNELLAVDVFECASVKAAHDQLVEALANMESDAIERRTEKNALGDIAFGLNDTMILFARANMVVLVRNAGPTIVSVSAAARELDQLLVRRLQDERRR
jgi:hypothetical protein